jgi:hypothetical protein
MWEWREDSINLIGATQQITLRVRYEKVLTPPLLDTDPVQDSLVSGPARIFRGRPGRARPRGERALALDISAPGQMETEKLIERYVRLEQFKGRRRMPNAYRRRVINV